MPYVTQSRRREYLRQPTSFSYQGGPNSCEENPAVTFWDEQVYTYRSRGTDDKGQSLSYEDLPGEQLRAEAMLQSLAHSRGDTGHEFWSTKFVGPHSLAAHVVRRTYSPGTMPDIYQGYILPSGSVSDMNAPNIAKPSSNLMNQLGAAAVRKFSPGHPPADLLVGLAELYREGLPHAVGINHGWNLLNTRRTGSRMDDYTRGTGSEYLNYQFGLKPLGTDIANLADVALRAKALWDRASDLIDTQVRRKGVVRDERSVSTGSKSVLSISMPRGVVGGNLTQLNSHLFNSQGGTLEWVDETHTRTWFSGAFTFYLDDFERVFEESRVRKAQHLVGISITPEVVWNVTPWSWLVDWFSDVGDVISNISASLDYSQVMRYGYLMQHTTLTRSCRRSGPLTSRAGEVTLPIISTSFRERKDRVRANPFGFGVDTGALKPQQWAILAALGLTRAPKALLT